MIRNISPMAIPGISTIDDIAASIWKIPVADLKIKTRKREVVEARQVLMAFRNQQMGNSLSKSSEPYGKDHATVIHAKKTVKDLRETDQSFLEKHNRFLNIATSIHK